MQNILDLRYEVTPQMLTEEMQNGLAWTRSSINPKNAIINIDDPSNEELHKLAASLAKLQKECTQHSPIEFDIPNLVSIMQRAKKLIDKGPGFAVIKGLPLDIFNIETVTKIYWILGQIIGRPVAQKWDESMLYEVRDTGQTYGYGVRGSYTNVGLCFHNDNAFNIAVPRAVGLLCINSAKTGGDSRFCSFYSIHNQLLKNHPNVLKRLYQPVYWDRQKEHSKGEPVATFAPIFRWINNQLFVRANVSLNRKGYEILGLDLDSETQHALEVFEECLSDPAFWIELPLQPGDAQYLNNQEIGHYRSEFEDYDDSKQKRCLVRTWHRESGHVTYNG